MESENYRSVVVKLHLDTLVAIDSLREQLGINSRADIVERILREVLTPDLTESQHAGPGDRESRPCGDDSGAI